MSIMLDNNSNNHIMDKVISGGFFHRSKNTPAKFPGDDRVEREKGLVLDPCSSSSSSSIGMNSDDDDDNDEINSCMRNINDNNEDEVESKLKNSPFDSAIDALVKALPIRRGISNFYYGKSKSFASLSNAASSSIKDITKTDNAYSRKRKNLLAHSLYSKGRTPLPKSPGIGSGTGGIAKRSSSKLSLVVPINNCESCVDENDSVAELNEKNSRNRALPPVPPPPWRSFSLADLQHCAVSASSLNSHLCPTLMGKRTKLDEVS